jgi:hypothetical protein
MYNECYWRLITCGAYLHNINNTRFLTLLSLCNKKAGFEFFPEFHISSTHTYDMPHTAQFLFKELPVTLLVKEFPTSHVTWRFITILHAKALSLDCSLQSIPCSFEDSL